MYAARPAVRARVRRAVPPRAPEASCTEAHRRLYLWVTQPIVSEVEIEQVCCTGSNVCVRSEMHDEDEKVVFKDHRGINP